MLADHQIRSSIDSGQIKISPYDKTMVQPASLDLRLGVGFVKYRSGDRPIDPESLDDLEMDRFVSGEIVLRPGEFVLGATLERVSLSSEIAARIEGKSTLGRLGLIVHSTAGFIDPGFDGDVTLEMANMNNRPIILRSWMPICQMAFYWMDSPVEIPYGHASLDSHYHGQTGATPPRGLKSRFSSR